MSGQSEDSGAVGSAAEEAVRLLGALSGWASDQVGSAQEHLATGAAECSYCPICRTVHAFREVSPEVRDHLVAAGTSLMHAMAGLLTAATAAAGRGHHDAEPDLERIRVDLGDQGENETEVEWPDL